MNRYIIMDKSAKMPSSCHYGPYRKIAVIEVHESFSGTPSMISERARGIVRIHCVWDRVYKGTSSKCAYAKAYNEAKELVKYLQNQSENTNRKR